MNIPELYKLFKNSCKVSTDSRKVLEGDIFFALKGPSFDGNKYAALALNKGASYAVIDNQEFKTSNQYILVKDVLVCLQQLARFHRNQFDIPFIAIAGSNGKTTSKELIREVCATSFNAYASPGNFNNEIGVPLTLLEIKQDAEIAIIEMGAKHKGDIKELCEITNPTHGIVTNTGKDHLETFGTLENTRKTNAELYEHLALNNGIAFVNADDDDLIKEAQVVKERILYGKGNQADIKGTVVSIFPLLDIQYMNQGEEIKLNSKLTGKYNFENIMTAVAVGKHFSIPATLIKKAIENYKPTNNRSQVMKVGTNTFIMDAYNANPSSMNEALENLTEIEVSKKVAVLGDMLELGKYSYEEHLLVVLKLENMQLSSIILVGTEFAKVKDKIDCLHFGTVELARKWFQQQQFENTTFLLKGSRGIALEKMLTK